MLERNVHFHCIQKYRGMTGSIFKFIAYYISHTKRWKRIHTRQRNSHNIITQTLFLLIVYSNNKVFNMNKAISYNPQPIIKMPYEKMWSVHTQKLQKATTADGHLALVYLLIIFSVVFAVTKLCCWFVTPALLCRPSYSFSSPLPQYDSRWRLWLVALVVTTTTSFVFICCFVWHHSLSSLFTQHLCFALLTQLCRYRLASFVWIDGVVEFCNLWMFSSECQFLDLVFAETAMTSSCALVTADLNNWTSSTLWQSIRPVWYIIDVVL